jgi:hypothetical protein
MCLTFVCSVRGVVCRSSEGGAFPPPPFFWACGWGESMAGMPDPLTDLPPPSRFDPEDLNSFALGSESVEISPPFIVVCASTPNSALHPFLAFTDLQTRPLVPGVQLRFCTSL